MVKILKHMAVAGIAALALSSCSSDEPAADITAQTTFTCPMTFEGGSRAAVQFNVGDSLFVMLRPSGADIVEGIATMQTDGAWLFKYSATTALKNGGNGAAKVAFGRNAIQPSTSYYKTVDNTKPLYGTDCGMWAYDNNRLELSAHMLPMNIRMKFTSPTEKTIMVKGVQTYNRLNLQHMFLGVSETTTALYCPCYPREISVGEQMDGTTSSGDLYFSAIGNNHYVMGAGINATRLCTHEGGEDCKATTLFLYDTTHPDIYYTRDMKDIEGVDAGSDIVIAVPEPDNHTGWELHDNHIADGPELVSNSVADSDNYYRWKVSDICGRAINFNLDKQTAYDHTYLVNFYQGKTYSIFRANSPAKENNFYSAIVSDRAGVASLGIYVLSSSTYYKNITYSEFPKYPTRIDPR